MCQFQVYSKVIQFYLYLYIEWASLVAQTVKCLSAMQETQVPSPGLLETQGSSDPWRRKWQPTPVFLPGKSHGQRSLVGYCPWGRKESDMTEWREDQFLPESFGPWFFSAWNNAHAKEVFWSVKFCSFTYTFSHIVTWYKCEIKTWITLDAAHFDNISDELGF